MSKWMITGHRTFRANEAWLAIELDRVLAKLVAERGLSILLCGMAIGTDSAAFDATLRATPTIPVHAYVPVPGQAKLWPKFAQKAWRERLERCERIVVCSSWEDDPFNAQLDGLNVEFPRMKLGGAPEKAQIIRALHFRNHQMVESSAGAIAVWDGRTEGGTHSAIQAAERAKLPIVVVDANGQNPTRIRPSAS